MSSPSCFDMAILLLSEMLIRLDCKMSMERNVSMRHRNPAVPFTRGSILTSFLAPSDNVLLENPPHRDL